MYILSHHFAPVKHNIMTRYPLTAIQVLNSGADTGPVAGLMNEANPIIDIIYYTLLLHFSDSCNSEVKMEISRWQKKR